MPIEAAIGGPAWLTGALGWIQAHPVEAALLLALASAVEGLFLIGMVIPGSLLMFSAGAIAVAGEIPLWPVLLIAALGAWLGDCLSFALGRRYRQQLPGIAAKLRMPGAIERAQDFFARHGGKSIVLGRFIGPLRPLLPAVAGAAAMSPGYFVAIDLLAALLWAPAYALPGVAVGATLSLAAEITGRFAALLGIALASVWLLWWLIHHVVRLAQRHAEPWLLRTMDWSHKHRRLGRLGPALADPHQPETPVLAVSLLALASIGWLLGHLWWAWPGRLPGPPALDDAAYDALAGLLTPASAPLALYLDALSGVTTSLLVGLAVLLLSVVRGKPRLAAHWMAGLTGGTLLGLCLPGAGMAIGPTAVLSSTVTTCLSLSLWLCLAGLITTGHTPRLRTTVYMGVGLLLGLMLLSRLILGQVSLSQLLIGLPLVLLWCSLLTLGFRRHLRRPWVVPIGWPLLVAGGAASVALLAYPPRTLPPGPVVWEQAERSPARINLHWLGSADAIEDSLQAVGWQALPKGPARGYIAWLLPKTPTADLPPAPQWLAGQSPAMRYRLPPAHDRPALILRLWPDASGRWLGQVGDLRIRHWAGLMRVPVTRRTDAALATLIRAQTPYWQVSRSRRETPLYVLAPQPDTDTQRSPAARGHD